jgi:hypothetical protein
MSYNEGGKGRFWHWILKEADEESKRSVEKIIRGRKVAMWPLNLEGTEGKSSLRQQPSCISHGKAPKRPNEKAPNLAGMSRYRRFQQASNLKAFHWTNFLGKSQNVPLRTKRKGTGSVILGVRRSLAGVSHHSQLKFVC